MSNIKVMDENLANKIAAGEVVERCFNVVKELVENSIDASSKTIEVNLLDSGVKEVAVLDDGIGMDREDAKLAFQRHATSKLKTLDDLFHLDSLGFRGEALPSIAAVSLVELKTSKNGVGTYLRINGGVIEEVSSCDLEQGTTIRVQKLFYNTPVRLKYLKNLYAELAVITDYMNKMALSYPDIQFKLTNNDKELLHTQGDGNLLKVIYAIYGVDVAKKMIALNDQDDDYVISGYISYPEMARSSRNVITTLVNGRVIKNNELNRVILDAYHTYIPKDRNPIVVLNIDVDPILIDINIHPQKMDIKFSKFEELKELIYQAISKELKKALLIPHASVRDMRTYYEIEDSLPDVSFASSSPKEDVITTTEPITEIQFNFEETTQNDIGEEKEEETRIKEMFPIGIVHKTYIIAENDDGMYLIDQHAAAERYNYEKWLEKLREDHHEQTDLLVPLRLEYPKDDYIKILERKDILKDIGIDIEEFGEHSFIVRSHPTWFKEGYEKDAIQKIIEIVLEKGEFQKEKFLDRTAATLACRMSIKANDYISLEEAKKVLDDLRTCENPFTCPHGRPTIIAYSNYELEKMFKRVMD